MPCYEINNSYIRLVLLLVAEVSVKYALIMTGVEGREAHARRRARPLG